VVTGPRFGVRYRAARQPVDRRQVDIRLPADRTGLVPLSAIPDPHKLRIQTRLKGKVMQDSTTDLMIFDHVVSFLSTYVTLQPGGIICTGAPGYRVRGRNIVNPVPAPLAIGGNAADPDGFLLWASFL